MIIELTEKNFDENIKSGLKLVEFYAEWCGFCQRQHPIIEELSAANIWIGTVNADKNPSLLKKYNVEGFPTFALFKDGKLIKEFSGLHSKLELMNKLL